MSTKNGREIWLALFVAGTVAACAVHASMGAGVGGSTESTAQDQDQAPPPAGDQAAQPAKGPDADNSVTDITDESGTVYHVSQGVRGAPAQVGCSDGQREAFIDSATFPNIAGCLASWHGTQSMRAPSTGQACGDDAGQCAVPGDACAPGWHVCGSTGRVADLRQVSAEQCEKAGGGRFSAGISHCKTQSGCAYDNSAGATYQCFDSGWCSESVCCGNDCGDFGACTGGVWANKTHIAVGTDQGCGATSSRRAGGVLCCRG